jgi:outer membrane protein OmpA-like peptidoglycan-associated protein/tetratricopeptide (TPR) repeat protein
MMTLRILLTTLATVMMVVCAQAQMKYSTTSSRAIKFFEEGLRFYDAKRNTEAEELFLKAIKADAKFIEAHILLGDTYFDMGRKREAIDMYKKVVSIDDQFFANTYFQLAQMEMATGEYAEAMEHFNKFLERKRINPQTRAKAEQQLKNSEFGAKAVKNPVPFNPTNMGPNVNTPDFEYFPVLTADGQTLVFTRNKRRSEAMDYQEDFYISLLNKEGQWGLAMNIGDPINTDDNEGAQTMTADGQQLFFTGCNRKGGLGSCDIYRSLREGRSWSRPENLGQPVNSNKWESQPSISSDGNTLYFSSNRAGGKGGSDIWVTQLAPNGVWSEPRNLGDSINTDGAEETPFIHPDGRTLYFTSNGHVGLGGKDIYVVRMKADGSWGTPKNLGYPINTWQDEMGLFVDASGALAYFASDREGGVGNLDIYSFPLYEAVRPVPVTYVKGLVKDINTKRPLGAKFELIDLSTSKTVIESRSDRVTGDFLVCLPLDRDYALNVSKDNYLFYSENFSLKERASVNKPFTMNVDLQPIEFGKTVVLRNIFFNTASFELKPESTAELEKLLAFMNSNPKIAIEIGGHTDNVGQRVDNQLLSENRAKAVFTYLKDRGVTELRMQFKGYADLVPVDTNDSPEGRANNRRTEFTVRELK